jgi:hypothetical protein
MNQTPSVVRDDHRLLRLLGLVVTAIMSACGTTVGDLPPVKTPLGVHLACHPPTPWPVPVLPPSPPVDASCGLPPLECGEERPLRLRVDEGGAVVAAYIPGQRSAELDECLLAEVRTRGWAFQPARECNGDPIAAEFEVTGMVICDPLV